MIDGSRERVNFVDFSLICIRRCDNLTETKVGCVMAFITGLLDKLKAHSAAKCESKQR